MVFVSADSARNATTASATPVDQVDEWVMMVADENNLRLGDKPRKTMLMKKWSVSNNLYH